MTLGVSLSPSLAAPVRQRQSVLRAASVSTNAVKGGSGATASGSVPEVAAAQQGSPTDAPAWDMQGQQFTVRFRAEIGAGVGGTASGAPNSGTTGGAGRDSGVTILWGPGSSSLPPREARPLRWKRGENVTI